jgi:HlyD family secretion protein
MKSEKKEQKEIETSSYIDELIDEPVKKPEKKKKLGKRTIWMIIGAVLIVLVIVLISVNNAKKAASTQTFQTDTLKKGELIAVVGGTGTVRANQTAVLTWQTTGRIENIHFAVGDQVNAGDEMANLAESSLPQSVILASSNLFAAQQALDKLKNSEAARSAAEVALAQAQSNYNTALSNFWNRTNTQGTEDLITITRAKLQIADNKVYDLKKAYDNMAELPDNDTKKATALQNLTQAQIDRDKLKKLLDYYEALPDPLDIATLQANLDLAKAKLADAQREYDRLKNGPDPAELAAAEANVAGIEATIGMAALKAPFSGTVTEVDSMVGDLVSPGTITFRLDDLNKLMVDVEVPEVDINSIKIGQPVSLTFDAIQNKDYSGKVTEVAKVGDTIGGVVEFKVTLQILNPDSQVLPGMTAAVNITVNKKENVLLVPNRAVRLVNNQYVIYLVRNGTQVMVPIVIGSTSDTNSEIVSGDVQEGDVIILNPSTSLINLMQSGAQSRGAATGGG